MIRGHDKKKAEILNFLQDHIPSDLLTCIPKRWWFVGDVLLLSIPQQLLEYKEIIGEAFLNIEQGKTRAVFGKIGATKDIIRTPNFVHLAGEENSETLHKELGCKFMIDAAKLTFSPGNHGERERLVKTVKEGEFIIDMFSCVGNLSLPLAVNCHSVKILATEINPLAHNYLVRNIALNNIKDKMVAILGDNRNVLFNCADQADRVLSGYFESDCEQKRIAFRICKGGGVIHFHETIQTDNDAKKGIIKKFEEISELENKPINTIAYKRVKKYSPNIEHLVFDVQLEL